MSATARVCAIADPNDPAELAALLGSGAVAADRVVAVAGKVDGSGNANDFSRALAVARIRETLRRHRSPGAEVGWSVEDTPIVLSSGCAGLISPNLTVFTREPDDAASPGLRVGRGVSAAIDPADIGRLGQVRAVAEATARAFRDAGEPHEVGCVLVKTPCLRPEHVRTLGDRLRTLSVAESMALANDASALGVAVALDEVDAAAVTDDSVRRDWQLYSRVAMVSAGPELSRAEVILLGNGAESGGEQRIGRGVIADPLDRDGVLAALADARSGHPGGEATAVQAFAKLILPVDDTVRGLPTSFFAEPSPATVAKAIGATLLGSVLGRTDVFVSGGERGSHQGPPGAGPVAIITRRGT